VTDWFKSDEAHTTLGSIVRRIPGFAGYLGKEERRASDAEARRWIVDRLDSSKRGLDAYTRALTDQGRLDDLAASGRLRSKIELLISRLNGAPAGYSSFFEATQVDEERLDDVLEYDLWLMNHAEKVATAIEKLATVSDDGETLPAAAKEVDALELRINERTKLLAGDDIA
jgi:hypothetical protein